MLYLFILFENKHFAEVTNLVINFIYHKSTTHSCTPIFYSYISVCMQWGGEYILNRKCISQHELKQYYESLFPFCWRSFVMSSERCCNEKLWELVEFQTIVQLYLIIWKMYNNWWYTKFPGKSILNIHFIIWINISWE